MNRKYIVICSFFVAFFVLSLLCYGSFEYAKKQEQKELAQQNAAQTSTKQEQRVTSETKLVIEKWEEESEELVRNGDFQKKFSLKGTDVAGKTLGIIGLGKIGKELARKARANGARVYLVNTGWNGSGNRISIKDTRAIIDDILSGSILKGKTKKIPYFDLEIPVTAEGAHAEILDPRNTYKDPTEWDKRAKALAAKFIENFKKFSATNEECKRLEKYGPHLD